MLATIELQTASIVSQRPLSARSSFDAVIARGFWRQLRSYRVFVMEKGMLCLDEGAYRKQGAGNPIAFGIGAMLGGVIGAHVAASLTASLTPDDSAVQRYDHLSDEALLAMARKRRKSFVLKHDEVKSIAIKAPSFLGGIFVDSSIKGWLNVREKTMGRVEMEIRDIHAMQLVLDEFPKRFEDRMKVRARLDDSASRFISV